MAYGIINVSKSRPCPICGKPDWCGFMPKSGFNQGELIICMRDTERNNTEGFDGRKYVFYMLSRSGNSIFDEYSGSTNVYSKTATYVNPKTIKKLTAENIDPKDPEDLNLIYSFLQKNLILENEHRKYLYQQGWTDEMINRYNIVSFPENDILRTTYKNRYKSKNIYRKTLASKVILEFGENSLEGVPGAYIENGSWTFNGPSGILFPMYNICGNIYRMRIRKDFLDVGKTVYFSKENKFFIENEKKHYICMKGVYVLDSQGNRCFVNSKGKYRTLSSFLQDKQMELKGYYSNKFLKGCRSGNELSFYSSKEDDNSIWYITEGEPKGAYANFCLKSPVVTLPGVNSYQLIFEDNGIILEQMIKRGMQAIIVAFDADKSHNDKVLNTEEQLIQKLKESGISNILIAEWNELLGKGIDDVLAAGGDITYRVV